MFDSPWVMMVIVAVKLKKHQAQINFYEEEKMQDRRDFLKAGIAVTAGTLVVGGLPDRSFAGKFLAGLLYTSASPGRWAGKEGSHAPKVTVQGEKLTITTSHSMNAAHYIVRHTLIDVNGETIGEKTFAPTDKEAVSVFEIPPGKKARYATSFCNRHDFWVSDI